MWLQRAQRSEFLCPCLSVPASVLGQAGQSLAGESRALRLAEPQPIAEPLLQSAVRVRSSLFRCQSDRSRRPGNVVNSAGPKCRFMVLVDSRNLTNKLTLNTPHHYVTRRVFCGFRRPVKTMMKDIEHFLEDSPHRDIKLNEVFNKITDIIQQQAVVTPDKQKMSCEVIETILPDKSCIASNQANKSRQRCWVCLCVLCPVRSHGPVSLLSSITSWRVAKHPIADRVVGFIYVGSLNFTTKLPLPSPHQCSRAGRLGNRAAGHVGHRGGGGSGGEATGIFVPS
ncbi:negative regulation of signal transduction [Homalodisca vitripennis]|nr:negative regulation of signal transduction [Homalodisca vitripennis]